MARMGPLVDAAWLAEHLDEVTVVDCRFVLGDPSGGREAYLAGHVPGARFLDLDTELSGQQGDGRHPLPGVGAFVTAARRAGIRDDQPVVAYDHGMAGGAARLWWLLRQLGKRDVAVLEGGIAAWSGELEQGWQDGASGDLTPAGSPPDGFGPAVVDATTLLDELGSERLLLLDARAPARFRGEHEPIDAVAGHIPGAVNLPFDAPIPDELREELLDPERDVVASCGSGVTACVLLLRLHALGREDGKLYAGSWSDWSARGLPVETGPGRSGI
jgi:thiosulfate/3-mercaptopyruvate sulfurtransferase